MFLHWTMQKVPSQPEDRLAKDSWVKQQWVQQNAGNNGPQSSFHGALAKVHITLARSALKPASAAWCGGRYKTSRGGTREHGRSKLELRRSHMLARDRGRGC